MKCSLMVLLVLIVGGAVGAGVSRLIGHPDDEREGTLQAGLDIGRREGIARDMEDLISPEGLAVVLNADRVEFFKQRIEWPSQDPWAIERRRPGTDGELAATRAVLLSPEVYSWDRRGGHKKCGGFRPRDVVRFWRGRESVTFLICFACSDVGVVYHNGTGHARPWMIADMQPGKAKLAAMMEGLFPGTVRKVE